MVLLYTLNPLPCPFSLSIRVNVQVLRRAREYTNRNVKGLDMEASAFFEACDSLQVTSLGIFKSVLDLTNSEKKDRDSTYPAAAGISSSSVSQSEQDLHNMHHMCSYLYCLG